MNTASSTGSCKLLAAICTLNIGLPPASSGGATGVGDGTDGLSWATGCWEVTGVGCVGGGGMVAVTRTVSEEGNGVGWGAREVGRGAAAVVVGGWGAGVAGRGATAVVAGGGGAGVAGRGAAAVVAGGGGGAGVAGRGAAAVVVGGGGAGVAGRGAAAVVAGGGGGAGVAEGGEAVEVVDNFLTLRCSANCVTEVVSSSTNGRVATGCAVDEEDSVVEEGFGVEGAFGVAEEGAEVEVEGFGVLEGFVVEVEGLGAGAGATGMVC